METTKEWFRNWFDTSYYHTLYSNRDYNEAERFLKRLSDELGLTKNMSILDLACGKGRHSIFLNSQGFSVIGLDLSKNSIDTALHSKGDGLDFSVEDMRTFELNKKFNVVMNLFTSFGYFENRSDNERVIHQVNNHLKDNGLFVIDFLNSNYVETGLIDSETKVIDGITFLISREISDGFVKKHIEIIDGNYNQTFHEKVQLFSKEEIESMLNKSGMTITSVFGDYELEEYDPSCSERLIIVAKKNL